MNTDPSLAVKAAYPAPTVKEAPAGVLLPGAVTNRVTIVSPTLTDLPPGAKIEIAFVFGTYLSAPVPYVAGKSFAFPAKELGIYLGTHVLVGYDLTIDGVTTPSERMDLYVMAFDDGDALLPTSIIVEASDRVLDLNPIAVDPTATCPAWKLGAEGQRAWWEVHGTLEDGTADVIVLYSEHVVTDDEVSGGLTKAVDLGRLKALKDGSTITVTLEVTFDMSGDRTRATRFPMQTYKILTKQPDEFVFDPTPHSLDVGTAYSRTASGGMPPYSYTSSNTAVATVNVSGLVNAINVGTAIIAVEDAANPKHTGRYTLSVQSPLRLMKDDFENMPIGKYTSTSRPGFTITSNMAQGVHVRTGSNYPPYVSGVIFGPTDSSSNNTLTVVFDRPTPSFRCGLDLNYQIFVEALDGQGRQLDYRSVPAKHEQWLTLSFASSIKAVRFLRGQGFQCAIDNFEFYG